MPICMRFFDESLEEELHRGIVIHVHGKHFAVRSVETIQPAEHTRAEIYYRDDSHKFVRLQAVTARSLVDCDQSTVKMLLLDNQGKYAEQRGSFRVSVADQGIKVNINAWPDCRPLDVCAEGLGVITAKPLKIGQSVSVNIVFGGERIDGLMIVRAVRQRKDKKYRCGLQAPSKNKELLKSLQTITMTVQRELLSRLAAVETATKQLGGGGHTANDRTSPVAPDLSPEGPGEREEPGGDRSCGKQARISRVEKPGNKTDTPTGSRDTQKRDRLSFDTPPDQYLAVDDQRNDARKKWRTQLTMTVPSRDVIRVIRTDAVDLSRGGYSFRTYREVACGSVVKTEITLGHKLFKVCGIVRHCTRVNERDYRVGVQFKEVTRGYIGFTGRQMPIEPGDARDDLFNSADTDQTPAARPLGCVEDHACPAHRNARHT